MTTRYFKASNGKLTIIRATSNAAGYTYGTCDGRLGFSNRGGPDKHKAVEITKAEYDALVARKNTRLLAEGRNPRRYTSPQESWVRNAELVEAEPKTSSTTTKNQDFLTVLQVAQLL